MEKTVHAVCPLDCPDTCSMLVTVNEGKAIGLRGNPDHSFTRGALCGKMNHYLELVYSDNRLKTPLRRTGPKGSGQFEPISWDDALNTIAAKFQEISNSTHGPQAILPYSYYGTMGKLQASSLDRRFFHVLGASKLDRTICASAGSLGYEYTVGQGRFGADPLAVPGCNLIINWGSNTVQTNAHLWSLMVDARKANGAKIITIDPYRSETAEKSDQHIQTRPGTDAALALGLMHVIFTENLQDQDYLDSYCIGAEALKSRVLKDYPPARVSEITGVTENEIKQMARELATTHPSFIRLNYGLQRHFGGGMAVRTIACLPAITGAWRHPGGGALLSTSGAYDFNMHALTRPDLSPTGTRTINMNQLAEALAGELQGPPVMAMYVYNCNPAAVSPNQAKVIEGLKREDLFTVVHDLFMTDSAEYADIVLPATSQLEHMDLHGSYGHHEVMLNTQAIEPLHEAKSNNSVFRSLAERMQFDPELFPQDETLMAEALEGGPHLRRISFESLQELHFQRLDLPEVHMPYAEGNFLTPSGKCELVSERMANDGLEALPTYTPAAEDPQIQTELARRFPIQLVSPPKGSFLNSTFGGNDWHRKRAGDPSVEISDEDALERRIENNDWVILFNDRGQFIARAILNQRVKKGVGCARGIHWNKHSPGGRSGVNSTTSSGLSDMGGGALFFDNLVELRKPTTDELLQFATRLD